MILKNAWYVACTPTEIDDKPLGRTICNLALVLYRSGDGTVAALEDFCPHRGAPLVPGPGGRGPIGVWLPWPGHGL